MQLPKTSSQIKFNVYTSFSSICINIAPSSESKSRANFKRFTEGYGIDYIVPENSTYATAIGAALCAVDTKGRQA